MIKHRKFGSIAHFRTAVDNVRHRECYVGRDEFEQPIYDESIKLPTLNFTGTVKSHGSNASIVIDRNGNYWSQSREQILNISNGLAGFYQYAEQNKEHFTKELQKVLIKYISRLTEVEYDNLDDEFFQIGIFGEWCGGNIQKGVAINGLPKMFIVYEIYVFVSEDIKISMKEELNGFHKPEINVYDIATFGKYNIDIDFENLAVAQETLTNLTLDVEKECPIGKYFGNIGVGEGIVWTGEHTVTSEQYGTNTIPLIFKVKGEKHSVVRTKEIVPIDIEKVNSVNQFIEYAVTENRLEQGYDVLRKSGVELSMKSTGLFIKWVMQDILKEESDTLIANNLSSKDINSSAARIAKDFWLNKLKF